MQKNIWIAAKYLRLSIEDGDKAESESIVNQSILIDNYMKSTSDITIVETFKDDGFSGTDFNRPGFQAMLKAIENKEINCIIVKDLSRFGREHIDVDRYIQKVFPQLGVRFIAINDNYDSETANITDTHLVLPVKSFVNDTYCRQNSQKVRSHLSAKRNIGEYVGNYVSYGYKKCDTDKSQIEIDPVAAKHVRDIFTWKMEGMSNQLIADKLNELGVLAPADYKRATGVNFKSSFQTHLTSRWSAVAIIRILIVIGQYIASKNEFKNTEVLEFKDDGYSGTNFDRPGFQSMMELVRDGKVSTIIVKDLSRFGRNHIEVDTYLEQIFPFMNVRFIAINDNVDSMKYESGMPGIDVGFRNIINEHHSIDTSVKVKRTLIQRQKAGKYMGARAPYGYLKPDEDVTSLVINPETAPVVKMIFQKYLDGMNITQLARYLNEQKIMSPGQYKREVLKTGVKKTTEKYIWYPVTVRLILMTETYTGTTIGGKWKVASVGSNKHLKTKEEDWIVVEGTHEAIVSKEVFDAVQEKLELNSRKRSKTHNNNYPLKGLVKCGGCGQNLQHVTRCNPHFKCPRKFNAANQDCVTDNLYDDEFNEMIFRAIKLFAKISDDAEPVLELQKAELKSKVNGAAKKIRDAKDSISRYKHQKTELYMRYAMEEISEEEFTRKNDKLDKQIEKETLAIAQIETEQSEAAERLFELPSDGRQCLTDLIEGNEQLTREIAATFIRGIKVYNDKRIEIEWNFADELVKYVEQVQKICS